MPKRKLPDKVKKNLLDNDYNKYVQYFNTCIIILFTYAIGVSIIFITKQINYRNSGQIGALVAVSIPLISILILLMLRFRKQFRRISEEIEVLKIG